MSGSSLFLSTTLEPLAEKLDALLQQEASAAADPFVPATIIVPSSDVRTWLQLYLARRQNIAINLRIQYLENALWEILGALSAQHAPAPVARLEQDNYRLLVLTILLEATPASADLKPLTDYLGKKDLKQREYCRRVWNLADELARLIRDYEYHRQDEFILKWIKSQSAFGAAHADAQALERCQRAVFQHIIEPIAGLRTRLSEQRGATFKTLPQYAGEVMEGPLRDPSLWPPSLRTRPIHLFGVAQISPYHIRALRWLSSHVPVRIYQVNSLVSRLDPKLCARGDGYKALQNAAKRFDHSHKNTQAPGDALLSSWAHAAAATLWRMAELLKPSAEHKPLAVELLFSAERKPRSVLQRVQHDLLAPPEKKTQRFAQDTSVQIAACPGIFREVQTVWNSIVFNLLHDKELRLNEIAVLVPRMELYRPVIQTVFDRDVPHLATGARIRSPISYSLGDCRASDLSIFGQALMAMIDAALDGFQRSRVLDVLTNPCFLARLQAAPENASVWLNWAEQLGVYHGWDQQDKKESGYTDSPLYSWRRALQRLRLGRIMETPSGAPGEPLPAFRDVVPYADIDSGDAERLNAFCRAIEELLPRLAEFRRRPATGAAWAERLRELLDDCLAIPEDRGDEAGVRSSLLRSLDLLQTLDGVSSGTAELTLPLIREFIAAQLGELGLTGASGRYGGVTISALQSARPIPFKIVYVLGLGEGLFPAPEIKSPFDLREHNYLKIDIRISDAQRLQFLEALSSARQKLYLLYSSKELQKDQNLFPCSLITQLRTYIEENVLPTYGALFAEVDSNQFKKKDVPLNGHDPRYLTGDEQQGCDLDVSYGRADRVLALQEALNSGELDLGCPAEEAQTRVSALAGASRRELLDIVTPAAPEARTRAHVNIRDLYAYLCNPARTALRRHLKIHRESVQEPCDDEPFYTDGDETRDVVQGALQRYVGSAAAGASGAKPPDYSADFAQTYEDRRRVGQAPDGGFAEADRARLRSILRRRIEGIAGSLAKYVRDRKAPDFCGRVQIGQSFVPTGARTQFPAVRLNVVCGSTPVDVQISGAWDLMWRGEDRLECAVVLHGCDKDKVPLKELSSHLFEPVLFYLALLCGDDSSNTAASSREWAKDRALHLTVARDDGFSEYRYAGIEPAAAREYLSALIADFLSPRTFDLLPFKTIAKDDALRAAFELDDGAELNSAAQDYCERLQAAIDQDAEFDFKKEIVFDPTELLELHAPEDAFAKVRRRFRLLDAGPRANRNEPAEAAAPETPGKAKSSRAKGRA